MISLFTASTVVGLTPMTLKLFNLMPPAGSPWIFAILIFVAIAASILGIMGFIIITSMVADVVEDTAVKTGVRSEGLLFATNGLVPKFTIGIGAFFAGVLLTAVHFPTHAIQGTVPMATMHHLVLLYLPTLRGAGWSASIVVLAFYRIDRSTHELREPAPAAAGDGGARHGPAEPDGGYEDTASCPGLTGDFQARRSSASTLGTGH